jgi:exosortase E/protease (VPEID-CTERM system)
LLATSSGRAPLLGIVAPFGIVTFAVFLGLGFTALKELQDQLPFHRLGFALHFLCVVTIYTIYGVAPSGLQYAPSAHIFASTILLVGLALLGFSCIPLRAWTKAQRATGPLWLIATSAGVLAACLRSPLQSFWGSPAAGHGSILQLAAFRSVDALLRLFLPNIYVDPATFVIGTQRFAVMVQQQCSGMEGLGLVLVFTVVWLWYFRKENRFPQALLLVPCALGFVWLLNIVRICAIILIGNAGAPNIAMVGFHSQAGWIAFTAVALSFSMATQRLSWVRSSRSYAGGAASEMEAGRMMDGALTRQESAESSGESRATAAYLVPFLAILAASFVSKAASAYFEWLYPLRFVAAAIAIWQFRSEYKKLNWRFGWMAPTVGAGIFIVWIAPEWWTHQHPASSLGTALAALSPAARATWIIFRVAAATITVPIAEELAFRGYIARRVMNRNFETVPFNSLSLFSVGLSSVAFGVMHGHQWMLGIVAGLAYAGVLKWRGRIGDAIVAHATSNLLLAAWVLLRGDWAQW